MLRLASKFFPLIEIRRISANLKFFLFWGRKKVYLEGAVYQFSTVHDLQEVSQQIFKDLFLPVQQTPCLLL